MNAADRQAFADQVGRAVAAAAARGQVAWGYRFDEGRLELWTRPADRKRKAAATPAEPVVRNRITRGVQQGTLL